MPPTNAATDELLREVRSVYAELASRPHHRSCTMRTECCHFKLTGRTPHLTSGEALVAAKALRRTGRKQLPKAKDGACPLLDPVSRRCLIYSDRPFGCRTHFCQAAGGMMARKDVIDLIHRLESVDAALSRNGPRILTSAVSDALESLA